MYETKSTITVYYFRSMYNYIQYTDDGTMIKVQNGNLLACQQKL